MLLNNFSAGIIGFILIILAFLAVGPVVSSLTAAIGVGVQAIINAKMLPLANILIEPAKVLFLNNALNHGIFTPLGTEQVAEAGKSILFLLESNPGPGLGILLTHSLVKAQLNHQHQEQLLLNSWVGFIQSISHTL